MLLAPGVVLGALVMAAENPAPVMPPAPGAEAFENVGRQKKYFDISAIVRQANQQMAEGKYPQAIESYRKAEKELRPFAGGALFNEKIEFCRKRIEQCYYEWAGEAMKEADELVTVLKFEEAIARCKEAVKFCPEREKELKERIVFYLKRRDAAANRNEISMGELKPDYQSNEYNIQLLIEQGVVLLKRDELMAARKKFDEVLLIDPYNEVALQNLMGINTRLRDSAKTRASAAARHLVGEVEWAASIPIVKDFQLGEDDKDEKKGSKAIPKRQESHMLARLKEIKFPSYTLIKNVMTFDEALEDLQRQAAEHDPKKLGVNFVIRKAKTEKGKAVPKLAGYSTTKPTSLLAILNQLQERGDLTFKVDDNAVVIAAKGVPLEKMTVRTFSFPIEPGLTEKKLMDALKAGAQVTFGPGAELHLIPLRNEIVSRNTPSNQERIENWTASRGDSGSEMVQIMFKFLEVAQNDLDELGFSWGYARRGNNASFDLGTNSLLRHYSNDDGNDRFGGTAVPSQIDLQAANPENAGDPDSTYGFVWRDRKNALAASVYALDWADSSDILYSPRVTTLNNTTATVNMTEARYFPGEYEDVDNESDEKIRYYVEQPQPSFEDARDLGIKFTIKPEIQGNDLIRARVNFNIQQFDSWLIVDSRNPDNEDDDGEYQKKAVLNTRAINTEVTLKDGETVLIGSIAQDLTNTLHDRIPILADIPFIGRFFQSRYTVSKKNNLLVFMTCKIIGPDGSAARRKESGEPKNVGGQRGLPVFPRNM